MENYLCDKETQHCGACPGCRRNPKDKSSSAPTGYVDAPRRRVELTIKIGADSWREAAGALADLEHRILAEGAITNLVSGGWSSGYSVTGSEDTKQTGDKYRKENAEYVKSLKAT